ncbi:HEPN domain-containing protein [Amycolatopsis pithecellobii]|uniref:Uncharacterized protein n=1 Tax=Amycolatopsis pithecellobii TaxID=664692 RepID=A0A6N7YQ04_9PSEU|nr:HEPN domain-containing protein [Amycolatopsis pithecellobii]MTD54082.1 hypothetical protein [Amycolatopsis pithecellobii]
MNTKRSQALKTALRRIRDSPLRTEPEDQLVDLVIAAEALYLNDQPKDRSELRHRASQRAALFSDDPDKPQIRRFIQSAYDARSAVAHGGALDVKVLRMRDGKRPESVKQFVNNLDAFIRAAALKAVTLVASGKMLDWQGWEAQMLDSAPPVS